MAISMLLSSCASDPDFRTNIPHEAAMKQCSDTQRNAISSFLQGIKEFSLALLRAVTPEGTTLYEVFGNNDERRGQEVVRQISAHPEISGESGSCTCTLLAMADTSDPQVKIVAVKRVISVDDDLHNYKRDFRVRFDPYGNCILTIDPIDPKWKRTDS